MSPPVPIPTDALQPPPPVELVPLSPVTALPTAAVFGAFARLRGRRPMHPDGVVRRAVLTVAGDATLPAAWRAMDGTTGVARFSRSVGLPPALPDVLGIALRFGAQDLLFASSGTAAGAQHVLVPRRRFDRTAFSTVLGHRVGNRAAILQARVTTPLPRAATALDQVRGVAFMLSVEAVSLLGRRRPIGMVSVGEVLAGPAAEGVRFDPWRAGGGITPAGPFQRWRAAAYPASRRVTRR